MIYKTSSYKSDHVRVIFELPASLWAEGVCLMADFNDWDPSATPLRQARDGIWRAEVDLPAQRRYEFRYLIDGRWCTDYHADGFAANGQNSVVETTLAVKSETPNLDSSMVHEGHYESLPFHTKRPALHDSKFSLGKQGPPASGKPRRPRLCGLCLEPEEIGATYTYIGQEYNFCSQECYDLFLRSPEYYIGLLAHDDRGHCGIRSPCKRMAEII